MESFGCVHLLSSFLFLIHFQHKDHLNKDFSQENGRPCCAHACCAQVATSWLPALATCRQQSVCPSG